jgi:hypothetical protein
VGKTLEQVSTGNDFLNRTPAAQQIMENINKWDSIKLKIFHTAKVTVVTRLKRQPREWEKIFASHTSDKGLITTSYRELRKLNSQRIHNPVKKWTNELNNFQRKKYKWPINT